MTPAERDKKHYRSMTLIVLGATIALFMIWIFTFWVDNPSLQTVQRNETNALDACRSAALALVKPDKVDVALLDQISTHCHTQVLGERELAEYAIRQSTFLRQLFEGRVILWMVLVITLSGVTLAALQLLAAYRLAIGWRWIAGWRPSPADR